MTRQVVLWVGLWTNNLTNEGFISWLIQLKLCDLTLLIASDITPFLIEYEGR